MLTSQQVKYAYGYRVVYRGTCHKLYYSVHSALATNRSCPNFECTTVHGQVTTSKLLPVLVQYSQNTESVTYLMFIMALLVVLHQFRHIDLCMCYEVVRWNQRTVEKGKMH